MGSFRVLRALSAGRHGVASGGSTMGKLLTVDAGMPGRTDEMGSFLKGIGRAWRRARGTEVEKCVKRGAHRSRDGQARGFVPHHMERMCGGFVSLCIVLLRHRARNGFLPGHCRLTGNGFVSRGIRVDHDGFVSLLLLCV